MNIIDRLCTLWVIAEEYEKTMNAVTDAINDLRTRIGERTTVHADIHHKGPDLIIAVGKYRGGDYVRAFTVTNEGFKELIKILRAMEPRARIGRMDMPGRVDFSAFYPDERL